jgi:hypothetical protein
MDAEATILNLRRASARERMARIRAKKKEARHVAATTSESMLMTRRHDEEMTSHTSPNLLHCA